jgi:hypothetical protein
MTCSRLVLGRISNRHVNIDLHVDTLLVGMRNSGTQLRSKVDTKELPRSRHHIEVPAAWFLLLRV